jgi:hypothetical protein
MIRRLAQMVMAAAIAGCGATVPPAQSDDTISDAGPAGLRASPPYRLDSARVFPTMAAIAAGNDELRVLYQREGSGDLRYVVLHSETGVTSNEAIPADLLPKRILSSGHFDLDLAFDSDAVLHALVGGRHLARRDGGWTSEEGPPCEAFVRGGPRLLCVGPPATDGATKHRWEWTFFPIYPPLPTFVPSRTALRTLAAYVHQPDGWHAWGIFDAASDLQTWAFRASATPSGDVHAVFARAGRYSADWRYEFAPGIAASASPQASAPRANRSTGPQDRTLDANCDPPPGFMEVGARWPLDSLSIDGSTGHGIVVAISYRAKLVCQRRIWRGSIGEPRVAFAGRQFTGVWLTNLGGDRFAIVLAEQANGTTADSGKSQFSFAVSDAGPWSSTAHLGVHVWSASYGGDAPLVGRGDGRAALVALDQDDRPVVIWLESRQ